MSDTVIHIGPALAVAVVLLAIIAALVAYAGRTRMEWAIARASVRATIQLGSLALVLGLLVGNLWASAGFVLVMAVIASWTAAGRVTGHRPTLREIGRTLVPVAAMTIVIVAGLVLVGVLPASGLAVIPSAGIMIGGAMNTTSLTGRRAADELKVRHGEVEAALSLGFSKYDARMEICRAAASTALVPAIDQTRTVGLVTIPGAFVGMVLGGASPTDAAIMQLFVLISLLAVCATALVLTTGLVAHGTLVDVNSRLTTAE
ncbi:ABC transporter permease [Nocardia sp. 348MFTsu5.1]|uniref:ABC transporter permease n=1 Tax=Nocardia sp. 348MFTsu5.1 TaxID=1172185 RepID=UPI00036EEFE0|nr:ABC transporter permease [Nocardia sp. 348MFTsu5.1]